MPPGLALTGRPAGEFVGRRRGRALARRSFGYVLAAAAVIVYLATRNLHRPGASGLVILAGVCVALAAVAVAVRHARVRIDKAGIAWGWRVGGVRMSRDRIARVERYDDGAAVVPRRGSGWFLSARDWEGLDRLPAVLGRAEIGQTATATRAPLRARLQGYGLALDLLCVADAVVVTGALAVALLL